MAKLKIGSSLLFFSLCLVPFSPLRSQEGRANARPKNEANATASIVPANILDTILIQKSSRFNAIFTNPAMHHVQVIYTQINRDENNRASFTTATYHLNNDDFFYSASMVKLPSCALAFEKVEELARFHVNANSKMLTDSANRCQSTLNSDTGSITGYPTISQYVKRMLLVSDNQAYSRMYEFLTPEYIHSKLLNKGYPTALIRTRFNPNCLGNPNDFCNPIRFLNDSGKLLYTQPASYYSASKISMPVKNAVKLIQFDHLKYNYRKDFSQSNYITLSDLHEMLKSIMFPSDTLEYKTFIMSDENRRLLWKYLQMLPSESVSPRYGDRNQYIDTYKKYLYYGLDSAVIRNKNIRIFNVVGESYGYTTDCAYIIDFENRIEFMISATYFIQNANGVIDGTSNTFTKFIMPFFRDLGQSLYEYERCRYKKNLPNLLEFKF